MPRVFLFDLDMTLVDSSALAQMRRFQIWEEVRRNMNLIRPFPPKGVLLRMNCRDFSRQTGKWSES